MELISQTFCLISPGTSYLILVGLYTMIHQGDLRLRLLVCSSQVPISALQLWQMAQVSYPRRLIYKLKVGLRTFKDRQQWIGRVLQWLQIC